MDALTRYIPIARRLLFGELGWVLAGNAAALVATAIGVKVLTSQLGAEEYGRLALGMTIPQIASQMLYGPLTTALSRYASPLRESGALAELLGTAGQLIWWITALLLILAVAAGIVAALLAGPAWSALIVAMSVFALFQGLALMLNTLEAAFRHRARAAMNQVLIALTRLGFGGGATIAIARTAPAAASGLSLGMAVVLYVQYGSFRSVVGQEVLRSAHATAKMRGVLLSYGAYFWVFGVFTAAQLASDVWALKTFTDDRTVGIYALAFLIASSSVVLAGAAVSQLVYPIAFQRAGHGRDPKRIGRATQVIEIAALGMAALTLVAAAVAAVIGGPLTVLLSTPGFRDAATYLPWLVLGLGLAQVGNLLGLIPMAMTRMRRYTALKIAVSVFTVATNIIGARALGITGVSASLIASGIVYILLMLLLNRYLRASMSSVGAPA